MVIDSFKCKLIEQSIAKNLKKTKRIKIIIKYYKINKPRYLRGIAQNPITTFDILDELINVKGIKYVKDIRVFALENIRKKKCNSRI